MDDPSLERAEHEGALRGLARINRISWASRAHLGPLRGVAAARGRPVRVLDVGAGSGDVSVAVARRAAADGIDVHLLFADISPRAVGSACERAERAGVRATGLVLDALKGGLPPSDLAVCSLFLHHLTAEQVVVLLGNIRATGPACVSVSDLRRCRLGTGLAVVVPRLVTRSAVVHQDAVTSARAAWTGEELLGLAERAGLKGARVRRQFPCRLAMVWGPGA